MQSSAQSLKEMAQTLAKHGQGGDNMVIHINKKELPRIEKALGTKGELNPTTGIPSFAMGMGGGKSKGGGGGGPGGTETGQQEFNRWKQEEGAATQALTAQVQDSQKTNSAGDGGPRANINKQAPQNDVMKTISGATNLIAFLGDHLVGKDFGNDVRAGGKFLQDLPKQLGDYFRGEADRKGNKVAEQVIDSAMPNFAKSFVPAEGYDPPTGMQITRIPQPEKNYMAEALAERQRQLEAIEPEAFPGNSYSQSSGASTGENF